MSLYIHKLDIVTSINLEIRLVLHSTRFTRYQLHDITNPFSITRDAKCHTHTTHVAEFDTHYPLLPS